VRREQPQHAIEGIGVDAAVSGNLRSRRAAVGANGIRRAAIGDDVQAARSNVRSSQVGNELGGICPGWWRGIAPSHGRYWLAALCKSIVMPRLRR
jgi:hypothetical protein